MRVVKFALAGLAALVLVALLGFKFSNHRFRLSHLPDAFGARQIIYAQEKVYGFGPGGNETGLIVYAMPPETAAALVNEGIAWLQDLAAHGDRGRRAQFATWHSTPVGADTAWASPETCRQQMPPSRRCPNIVVFLDRYGFGLPLDASVERMVNDALFAPGAYWSAGHGALLVVIPAEHRIVFAYSG